MKQGFARATAVLLMLAALVSVLPIGVSAAAAIAPTVTSYEIQSTAGNTLSSIQKGNKVNLILHIKDTGVTNESKTLTADDIDATKLVDSFSNASAVTPSEVDGGCDGVPLTYTLTVKDVTYSGTGKSLRLMIGYAGAYTTIDQTISQAVEYEEPAQSDIDIGTPDTIPTPMIIISRGEITEPIKAGQKMEVTIQIQNLSNVALRSPIIKYSPSDSLMLTGGSSTFVLEDIAAKKTVTTTVEVQALTSISSSLQNLGVELTYNYYNNISTVQASASEQVTIPATPTTGSSITVPEPPVIITRSALNPISANQTFDLTLTFQNAGTTALVSPVATVSTSEALVLQNDTSTFVLEDIPAGASQSITLTIKAASEIMSTTQSVIADLRFSYDNGSGLVQSSTSERVNIAANVTQQETQDPQTASPVPNIIISDFGFGGDSVAAGEPFNLSFTFTNTGRLAVENIVVLVDGGECFTMNGSTNTFYYDSLAAGGSLTQEVPMQTLAAAKTGAQTVNVSFRYEYVDDKQRASSSADIKLSVPVYQPDRLQIDDPSLFDMAYAGMETTITMSYVNKGKGDISNVEASISGDVDALQPTQYLGNFASGQSGNISFVVTPWTAGDTELMITITYEDANAQTVTREFPMTLPVMEMNWGWDEPYIPEEDPMMQEEDSGISWVWIAVAAGGVLLVLILVIVVRHKKKKAAARRAENEWSSWDDELPDPPQEQTPAGVGGKEA